MKLKARHSAIAFLLALITLVVGCQSRAPIPKVVFILVDGVPADVIERTATPNFDKISSVGGYTQAFVGGDVGTESESPTLSAPNYMSLITGTWSHKHKVYDNDVEAPDYQYWDIFRIANAHDSALHTAIFSSWEDNRTKLIGDGKPEAGGHKIDYSFDGLDKDTTRFPHDLAKTYINKIDDLVASAAAQYIADTGPDLSWVYLWYPDAVGHAFGDSPEQTQAVQVADDRVGRIWDVVRVRERVNNEDWLIVVTTDHGRDAETGKDHGSQS